jgi:hypothetical protein
MAFIDLRDTYDLGKSAYEAYVFDAGYVVSECEKGVYKIDGVTLLDKDYSYKDVTIDSFIRVADERSEINVYVGTLKNTWHLGYTYYITKASDVDKVISGVTFKNIKCYFKSSDLIIVGIKITGDLEEFVIVLCVNGFRCGNSYHRPKLPAMILQDAGEFIGVYLDKGEIVFRPYGVGLNNCRINRRYATVSGLKSKLSENTSFCFVNGGEVFEHYIDSSGIVEVEGVFLKIGEYYTLDKSKNVDDLIFPDDCKYIFGGAIAEANANVQTVVFSKNIVKYIAEYADEPLFWHCRNLKCLYFSRSTPLKTVIKLCRNCLISDTSDYYSEMTNILRGIDGGRFNSIEECISEAEKWLHYPFKDISIKFY